MTYTDSSSYTFDEPVTLTSLNVVIDVSGDTNCIRVPDDAVQVGIGRKCWSQFESYMDERGVRATISGAYFTGFESWSQVDYGPDVYEIGIRFEAVALISFDQPEDEVRWGRDLLAYCGAPEPYQTRRSISRHHVGAEPVRDIKDHLGRWARDSIGNRPGEHRSVRTPVSVLN